MRPVTKISLFGLRLGAIALAVYWLAIFAGTHLPKPPDVVPLMNDKVKHFTAYFGLGLLLCYVSQSPRLVKRFSIIAFIGLAYAVVDELTQMLVPNRFADIADFAADALGIFIAISVYAIVRRLFRDRLYMNSRIARAIK